jgi:comEA protein
MKFTSEEKTILITIVIAAVAGLFINIFLSYNKKIEEKPKAAEALYVNINTADAAELDRLPGVGKVLAERIVSLRRQRGGFKTIEDIKDIKGITGKKFEKMKKYLTVSVE